VIAELKQSDSWVTADILHHISVSKRWCLTPLEKPAPIFNRGGLGSLEYFLVMLQRVQIIQ
jgi:hypothetical protein